MFNTPDYNALINVAKSYAEMQEASTTVAGAEGDDDGKGRRKDKALNKADEDFQKRLAARRKAKAKPSGAAARMAAAADKHDKERYGAKEDDRAARREKLKAKFGGRQGRMVRRPGDLAADDLMAMDGNKRAAKRMINRGKIADAKQEGEERKKKGDDNTPPAGKTVRLPRKGPKN